MARDAEEERARGQGPRAQEGGRREGGLGTAGKPSAAKGAPASSAGAAGAAGRGRVCVGAVAGARGTRGEVRIRSFTADAAAVAAYGPVSDESGARTFEVRIVGRRKDLVIARLSGVADRPAAEALRGLRLYVPRSALPTPEEDEFYHADLLGLEAVLADGARAGTVTAILPAGGADVLEIDPGPGRETLLVPFTAERIPEVDLAAGRLTVADGGRDGRDGTEDGRERA